MPKRAHLGLVKSILLHMSPQRASDHTCLHCTPVISSKTQLLLKQNFFLKPSIYQKPQQVHPKAQLYGIPQLQRHDATSDRVGAAGLRRHHYFGTSKYTVLPTGSFHYFSSIMYTVLTTGNLKNTLDWSSNRAS